MDRLFQPANGLIAALLFAALFAAVCLVTFEGQRLFFYLYYFVPISVPFVGFLFDRAQRYTAGFRSSLLAVGIDALVVGLALVRAVYALPWISGHALFLVYAVLTVRSRWARIPAVLVLAQVVYLKIFVWHDLTLLGGALLAYAAAWGWGKVILKVV